MVSNSPSARRTPSGPISNGVHERFWVESLADQDHGIRMPIRQVDTDDKLRIFRTFKIGKLADMIMLDTRQYDRDIT